MSRSTTSSTSPTSPRRSGPRPPSTPSNARATDHSRERMSFKQRLGVNVDHVATVRNARGTPTPDPLRAALLAAEAGADGIPAHLREDRRHIVDDDIARLKDKLA